METPAPASSTYTLSNVARAAFIAASNGVPLGNSLSSSSLSSLNHQFNSNRRYSVAALWSLAAEHDVEVDDDLTKG